MRNVLELKGLRKLLTSINPRTIYLYSVVIGVLSGLGALVFNELLHAATEITMHGWARVVLPEPMGELSDLPIPAGPPRRWVLFFLPVVGGLISGLLVKTFAPEAEGTGTDGYIDAFVVHRLQKPFASVAFDLFFDIAILNLGAQDALRVKHLGAICLKLAVSRIRMAWVSVANVATVWKAMRSLSIRYPMHSPWGIFQLPPTL